MAKKRLSNNMLPEEIYKKSNIPFKRIITISFALIFIGFFLNFPIKETLKNLTIKGIDSFKSCPISYSDIEVSFFLPKLKILRPTIPGFCFRPPTSPLILDDITIRPSIPSFFPPGIRVSVQLKHNKSLIKIYPAITISKSINIKIPESQIDSELINHFFNGRRVLDGFFTLESSLNIANNKLQNLHIKLESKNLVILGQNIEGFALSSINMGDFSLRGILDKRNNFKIKKNQLILGNPKSPLRGQLGGNIKIRKDNITLSSFNMSGELRIPKVFMTILNILNNFGKIELQTGEEMPEEHTHNIQINGKLDKLSIELD